jgi:hypothetical protein
MQGGASPQQQRRAIGGALCECSAYMQSMSPRVAQMVVGLFVWELFVLLLEYLFAIILIIPLLFNLFRKEK